MLAINARRRAIKKGARRLFHRTRATGLCANHSVQACYGVYGVARGNKKKGMVG